MSGSKFDSREVERVLRERERLRFRVYAATREAVLATELFRSHAQLHEPEIATNVYPGAVEVVTTLSEGQLRLLRADADASAFSRFVEDVRSRLESRGDALGLRSVAEAPGFGRSEAVRAAGVPCGYRALFLRERAD